MATKKELEETIADVRMLFDKDCGIFKRFDDIDKRLDTYNSNAAKAIQESNETKIKLAKTEAIAREAKECSDDNSKNFNRFLVAFVICLLGIVFGIGLPTWMG